MMVSAYAARLRLTLATVAADNGGELEAAIEVLGLIALKGTPRKLMDSARLHALGWSRARGLEEGIAQAYSHWLEHGGRGAA
jgi:nucleoside-diphosphate-sugar epimerase